MFSTLFGGGKKKRRRKGSQQRGKKVNIKYIFEKKAKREWGERKLSENDGS